MGRAPKAAAPADPVAQWPADHVERRAVAGLVPYARNARTHSDTQVAQLAASIREWGWTMPVLVDEAGTLIAGHGRVMAAQQLKLTDVPTMVARGWSEAQKRAYILADNKLALNAGWDGELLASEISDLEVMQFDTSLIGFLPGELQTSGPAGEGTESAGGKDAYKEQYGVIVICRDEGQQREVYERLVADGLEVKVVAT